MAMRVLVTGSRDWPERETVRKVLDSIGFEHGFVGMVVVHGHCPTGADAMADEWARDHADLAVTVERHPADWKRYGKAAGPKRNQEMVDLGADMCVAFMMPGSRGTKHCALAAKKAGIWLRVYGPADHGVFS